MKSLVNYIAESKTLHQNVNISERLVINQQFDEKLIINKNYNQYTYAPKSFKELKNIIIDRLYNVGPGTEHKPIDFNDVDVSNIDSFYNANINEGIFDATKFEYIDITDWNVSKVKDMYEMFNECYNLKSVGDLSNWDVSNVEDISSMFDKCINLKSVGNLSKWNVSKVENMSFMFEGCEQLKSVGDLSKWDVSKVKYMSCMFDSSGITNIPNWYKE